MSLSEFSTTELMSKLRSATRRFDRLMDGASDNPHCFPQADVCKKHGLPIVTEWGMCQRCDAEITAAEARADERREGNF